MILQRGHCAFSKGGNQKILASRLIFRNLKGSLNWNPILDQFEYEDIEEDQPAENLTTILNMEDKTD